MTHITAPAMSVGGPESTSGEEPSQLESPVTRTTSPNTNGTRPAILKAQTIHTFICRRSTSPVACASTCASKYRLGSAHNAVS